MEMSRRVMLAAPVMLKNERAEMEVEFTVRGVNEADINTMATVLFQACEKSGLNYVGMNRQQSFVAGKGAMKYQSEFSFMR